MPLQTQPVLDLDLLAVNLLIEHDGHKLKLTGSDSRFVASFPTLAAFFHFGRVFWNSKNRVPPQASLHLEWRPFRVLLKKARD